MSAPAVLSFVSWSLVTGRSAEIAGALHGEARSITYPTLARRRRSPSVVRYGIGIARYGISSAHTIAYLIRRRPRSVITTLPPVIPGIVAWGYCTVTRRSLVLDSHPSSFGRKGNRVSQRLLPVHRWLARRALATMVTTDELANEVESWGGHGIVVHEAPSLLDVGPPPEHVDVFDVLLVCVFSGDEPVDAAIEAVRELPDVRLRVTGDRRRCDPALIELAPPNVEFVGYLGPDDYRDAVEASHAVLALTTEPTSVMRAAYEAVYAHRPLVTSDWPCNQELFEHAVLVTNSADGIRDGLTIARRSYDELVISTGRAFDKQIHRWNEQLAELRDVLGLDAQSPAQP